MLLRDMPVRRRLLIHSFIMVVVPVFLVGIIFGSAFLALRATGSFRDREMELVWGEGGSAAPVALALGQLRAYVDFHQHDGHTGQATGLRRKVKTLEERGMEVAAVELGNTTYETRDGSRARAEAAVAGHFAGGGNVALWDESGLYFRYYSDDGGTVVYVHGTEPFDIGPGVLPEDAAERYGGMVSLAIFAIIALVVIAVGVVLSRKLSRDIARPLEDLSLAAMRLGGGDYETRIETVGVLEAQKTAFAFEEARARLARARRLREAYERNRTELLAKIAHDLATPLTKIRGYTEGILDGVAASPEKRERYLRLVLKTSKGMERLIGDLFLLSKLELGEAARSQRTVTLYSFLDSWVSEERELLREGFTLSLEVTEEARTARASIDEGEFSRVLQNILANSLRYRVGTEGSLALSLSREGERLKLRLADTGQGVAAEELGHLFESFYRTDEARSETGKGSGLGLAIVAAEVKALGGRVWAEKNEPRGLVIVIELPIKEE